MGHFAELSGVGYPKSSCTTDLHYCFAFCKAKQAQLILLQGSEMRVVSAGLVSK